jgi:D-serine deaminase-like pyridoxal phosphate-dependent protein
VIPRRDRGASPAKVGDLPTPSLIVDAEALEHNIATMAAALPGERLRPHVKAHKCTSLARRQASAGHRGFACATIRECEGMAAAGLGGDLLLANEVLDASRLGALVREGVQLTVAVDSPETIDAAVAGGVRRVLIDVNVGLPRCGCAPERAGELARSARRRGLEVRGVMGYEGHVVGLEDAADRGERCRAAMELLVAAHRDVGGELISAGGTGTYACNVWASEIQAGSYALMDVAYSKLDLPFRPALFVLATVVSSNGEWAVADAGLKALGMDRGKPRIDGAKVWFCSDEHTTFAPSRPVGELVRLVPGHIDPTMSYHERLHLYSGDEVIGTWPIDLRGW